MEANVTTIHHAQPLQGVQRRAREFIALSIFFGLPGTVITIATHTAFNDDFFRVFRYIGFGLLGLAAIFGVTGMSMYTLGRNQTSRSTDHSNRVGMVTTVMPNVVVNQVGRGQTAVYTAQTTGCNQYSGGTGPTPYGHYSQHSHTISAPPPPSYGQYGQSGIGPPPSVYGQSGQIHHPITEPPPPAYGHYHQ